MKTPKEHLVSETTFYVLDKLTKNVEMKDEEFDRLVGLIKRAEDAEL
jgi:hypothetical protein